MGVADGEPVVGECDGAPEGKKLGVDDGELEGLSEGDDDGARVGEPVGLKDGKLDGDAEGLFVGNDVGRVQIPHVF